MNPNPNPLGVKTIGIIGGGQLGKMLSQAATELGLKVKIYTDNSDSPATHCATKFCTGQYNDAELIYSFLKDCDFITFEFESIDHTALINLQDKEFATRLKPSINALEITNNRLREKQFLQSNNIPVTEFADISSVQELETFFNKFGDTILKTQEDGYDGKGQFVISSKDDLKQVEEIFITNKSSAPEQDKSPLLIAEKKVKFEYEISCILTRNNPDQQENNITIFPIARNEHHKGILHQTIIDESFIPDYIIQQVKKYTQKVANSFSYIGTMAIEYFVYENKNTDTDTESLSVLVNEISCRPHNSGHFSIDLCNVSQFSNHIRAVCDMPIITPILLSKGKMVNILGDNQELISKNIDNPTAKIHLYGKRNPAPNRKMGHITFIENANENKSANIN